MLSVQDIHPRVRQLNM